MNEEKGFTLTFPEKYFKEELSGKEVDFKAKVNFISKVDIPEMTDELAKSFGEFENLEALKNSVKEGMNVEKIEMAKQSKRAEILEKIIEESKFEVPDLLVQIEKERMTEELKVNLQNQFKVDFKEYLDRTKKTEKEIFDSFEKEAEKRAKSFLILKEIANKEKISAIEEETEEKVNEFLKQYPDIKKAEKEIDLDRVREYYKEAIINEKVFQLLEQQNN
jgi:trigger factor